MPAKRGIGAQATGRRFAARAALAPVLVYFGLATGSTESAVANGDTRTINLSNQHTNESGAFTYMVNGAYDPEVLEKLNWFLRDWRLNEPTKMDPKLFDIVWEVYRESGSTQPIDVLSGYRSPQTNAMLRMRSRQVAEHSQHMLGKAMDAHFLDVSTARIRDITMRLQAGGVGFYPTGNTPWVHIDSGSVRYWPRISHDQMVRLFPDGKTVFVPSDGQPLWGYEQARAEIEARGGDVIATAAPNGKSNFGFLAFLFGGGQNAGGADDAEEGGTAYRAPQKAAPAAAPVEVASASAPDIVSRAKRNLPKGETSLKPAEPAPAPAAEAPQLVASAEPAPGVEASDAPAFVAPLPPRRPPGLYALLDVPMPPVRPAEFTGSVQVASAAAVGGETARKNDLIAALLARGRLPVVITRGVTGGLPNGALALADVGAPEPPERPALLARAEALDAPLPPVRTTIAPKSAPANALQALSKVRPLDGASAAGLGGAKQTAAAAPFGALSVQAFAPPPPSAEESAAEAALYQMGLRGSAN